MNRSEEMVVGARHSVFLSDGRGKLKVCCPVSSTGRKSVRVWVLVYGDLDVPIEHSYYHEPPPLEGRTSVMCCPR